ncbi:MAG: hypothetical protein M3N45_06625 [Actinomycetota bacterium]|nr:hypothetical protein [Actinomycetota bacterium]
MDHSCRRCIQLKRTWLLWPLLWGLPEKGINPLGKSRRDIGAVGVVKLPQKA